MSRLSVLADQLSDTITKNKLQYDVYKAGKDLEDALRQQVQEELISNKLKQVKTDSATISLNQKQTFYITNEVAVRDWLENTPDVEADAYIGVKKPALESLAKVMLKQTGEIIPGTDMQVSEILSIRTAKKEQSNGQV